MPPAVTPQRQAYQTGCPKQLEFQTGRPPMTQPGCRTGHPLMMQLECRRGWLRMLRGSQTGPQLMRQVRQRTTQTMPALRRALLMLHLSLIHI